MGKGSGRRPEDGERYKRNWDNIVWKEVFGQPVDSGGERDPEGMPSPPKRHRSPVYKSGEGVKATVKDS